MEQRTNLLEILKHIDPSVLNYQEWVNVGMALKQEGYAAQDWENWSIADAGRYHRGECQRKWRTFNGNSTPVTGGTIYQMAVGQGWKPPAGFELDWDSEIAREDSKEAILDGSWIEGVEMEEPSDAEWNPVKELITYLEILFGTDENVGYVTRSWSKPDDNEKYPDKGSWDRTARQLIQKLSKCKGDIGSVLGDYDPSVGAWIRFNPLDGNGCKDKNVTDFRYSLVESDNIPLEKQNALIRELELPVACMVYSGGKSIHAIVRVEASNYEEYRKRVDYLYKVCQKNGLDVDIQNKNPSRLSRMPGVMRNGKKQFLVATNIGKRTWEEWHEWIESVNDDLPEPEDLASVWDNLPELSPCLIENVLRQGHKMLIAGPSKAGKSFLQIELCIAIAEGAKWLNWQCVKGRVLYCNLELDRASCLHRFKDVYEAMGLHPDNLRNIDIWNLRGKSAPMDKLAPKLIRRALKKNYIAVIIDPIYKVLTGDENSADQMAAFCNQFDKICTELNTAVIYCHHHSKGSQGSKRSMDRASGSGVFARDPDALLDLIELDISEDLLKQEVNKAVCDVCTEYLKTTKLNWEDELSQDDFCSSYQMQNYCENRLDKWQMNILRGLIEQAKKQVSGKSAWRIEGTLREFQKFPPVNIWFQYPVHVIDDSGALGDIQPEAEKKPAWQQKKKSPADRKKEKEDSLRTAFEASDMEGTGNVKLSDLSEYMGISVNTVKKRVDESKEFQRENGMVSRCQKT